MWQSMDWFMGIYWNMFRLWDIAAEPTLSLCFFDQLYFWLIELLNLAAPVSKLHIFMVDPKIIKNISKNMIISD